MTEHISEISFKYDEIIQASRGLQHSSVGSSSARGLEGLQIKPWLGTKMEIAESLFLGF